MMHEDKKEALKEKSIEVELSYDKYQYALGYGARRSASYVDYGVDTARSKSVHRTHLEGAVGEMMVCKHFGVNFDDRVIKGGDEGNDLDIGGESVDVKANTYENPDLQVKTSSTKSDIYILVHLVCDPIDPIPMSGKIVGYMRKEDVLEYEPGRYTTDLEGYSINWSHLEDTPERMNNE